MNTKYPGWTFDTLNGRTWAPVSGVEPPERVKPAPPQRKCPSKIIVAVVIAVIVSVAAGVGAGVGRPVADQTLHADGAYLKSLYGFSGGQASAFDTSRLRFVHSEQAGGWREQLCMSRVHSSLEVHAPVRTGAQ